MTNLKMIVHFEARPGRVEELRGALRGLIEPTRKDAGCIRYELWQGLTDSAQFTFVEEWESESHLEAHIQTARVQSTFRQLPELVVSDPVVLKFSVVE